jgi:hypothetical protein
MEAQQVQSMAYQKPLAPSEEVKRYIIQLSKDCTELLALTYASVDNQYAFAMKTRLLSIWLEPYTEPKIKEFNFKHYKELDDKIQGIRDSKEYNDVTKAQGVAASMFQYGIPICFQSIRILQNSKILEQEVEGVIDLSNNPGPRIRGEEPQLPIMKELTVDESEEDNHDGLPDQP